MRFEVEVDVHNLEPTTSNLQPRTSPVLRDLRATDVLAAGERIRDLVRRTPLVRSAPLSQLAGGDVFLKLENEQTTGSFKLRGALNAIGSLGKDL